VTEGAFPSYPPGLWRRIVLQPGDGWIAGALEDDMHRFHLRIDHAGGIISAARAEAVRHPWTACPGAAPHIAAELVGAALEDVARRDATLHCTHLYDLAVLVAAHAGDTEPTWFDIHVADRAGTRTTATLAKDGVERLRWQLDGTMIVGPGEFAGRDIKRVSQWKHEYGQDIVEQAPLLRRVVFISGGRAFDPPPDLPYASQQGPARIGVCFNFQLPRAEASVRRNPWHHDFSAGGPEPLAGFDPVSAFAAMAPA